MAWKGRHVVAGAGLSVVCWDLDSTLRSTRQRWHMLPDIRAGLKTWDDYSMACADDEPIEGSVALVRLLHPHVLQFGVSGCSDAAMELTAQWCTKHSVLLDDFILRPAGDETPNGEFKVSVIERLQAAGLIVQLFVEDWAPSAAYIRDRTGIPVLGVNPFDEGAVLVTRDGIQRALTGPDCPVPDHYASDGSLADYLMKALTPKGSV